MRNLNERAKKKPQQNSTREKTETTKENKPINNTKQYNSLADKRKKEIIRAITLRDTLYLFDPFTDDGDESRYICILIRYSGGGDCGCCHQRRHRYGYHQQC